MELLKLLGIVIVIAGFALKLDSILVILVAAVVTALVGGLGPVTLLETLGSTFVANRSMAIFIIVMLVTGTLERNGLREAAAALIGKFKGATSGLDIGLSALNGVALGVLVAIILLMIMNRDNKPSTFLNDSERMLSTVGPLSMLPMLLACLGSVFTAAGVGDVISDLVSHIIPEGNVNAGIVVYAIGMMLFTMIMGNAYAAITVMTVGIGYPFVLAHGANPVVIGMLALTCGFCGTLCTPMAANFNTVPVALLDMKKPMGVIKNQVPVAIIMMVVQIVMMILLK